MIVKENFYNVECDYCPDCWELDDDDNIVTKDGKVWDWDTGEFLRNTGE